MSDHISSVAYKHLSFIISISLNQVHLQISFLYLAPQENETGSTLDPAPRIALLKEIGYRALQVTDESK